MGQLDFRLFPEFNSQHLNFQANPYHFYHYLRTRHPVYYRREQDDWLLTRHADIVAVLQDNNYGHAERETPIDQQAAEDALKRLLQLRQDSQFLIDQWIVLRNPPEHKRLRQLLKQFFTPQKVMGLKTQIQAIVDDLIGQAQDQGSMDIIADLANPLPVKVIAQIMGIPEDTGHPHLKRWSHDLGLMVDLNTTLVASERSLLAMMGLARYFRKLLAQWQTSSHHSDNLISQLLQAQAEGVLSEAELVGNCIFLFVGGHLTTQNLIGNGMLALLQHPQQLALLRKQPDLAPQVIHEILRYDPPIQVISRTACSTMTLAGHTIKAGQIVHCILGAGNRDPAQFSEPDQFDVMRKSHPALAFGSGIHYCLGSHLAHLEGEIAIASLVSRYPNLELASPTLEWEDNLIVHGLKSLPVRF